MDITLLKELDKEATEVLGEVNSFSALVGYGTDIYLVIHKPTTVSDEFWDIVTGIEERYGKYLGKRIITNKDIKYLVGKVDVIYTPYGTDTLMFMQVNRYTYDITNARVKYDFGLEDVVQFITDNPEFVFRVVDGRQLIVGIKGV